MKKSSKVLSLVLAALMAVSCFTGLTIFSASAETKDTKVYFDVTDAPEEWGTTKTVYCYIYNVAGDETLFKPSWQAKSTRCTKDDSTGLYYFDTATLCDIAYDEKGTAIAGDNHGGLRENCDYGIIFSTSDTKRKTHQTCNMTFGVDCLGDTMYLVGGKVENSQDSTKLDDRAAWKNNGDSYGPMAGITSLGNVVDGFYPKYLTRAQMVAQSIFDWAVKNDTKFTAEKVADICTKVQAEPMDVYNAYAEMYAVQLADPEAYPTCAPLDKVAELLGVDPTPTTVEPTTEEPTTVEPTTEEPTTVEPTTEEPTTVEPTTEEPTTEEPTTVEPTTEGPKAPLYGDATGDKVINIADATFIQKAAIAINDVVEGTELFTVCDTNVDGRISIKDVTLVKKYIVNNDAGTTYNTGVVGQPIA